MHSVLLNIAEHKKIEVAAAKKKHALSMDNLTQVSKPRDFMAPLYSNNPAIIAEIKKASPSKGVIRESFDVAAIAETYTKHGAACLSVLTDSHFFKGDNQNIGIAKQHSELPVLRKDFIIDPWQIKESRFLMADCILLIVALLDDTQLIDFTQQAQELGMAVLVESHTMGEFERAMILPTPLMGVNNRSLHSFETNLSTSFELARCLPSDKILISESGIHSKEDIHQLMAFGITRFLIGESFMREDDIGKKMDSLLP